MGVDANNIRLPGSLVILVLVIAIFFVAKLSSCRCFHLYGKDVLGTWDSLRIHVYEIMNTYLRCNPPFPPREIFVYELMYVGLCMYGYIFVYII